MPMNFKKLSLDGRIVTEALTSAISEQGLDKIKLVASEAINETDPPPNHSGKWSTRTFFIMENLPNPLFGL